MPSVLIVGATRGLGYELAKSYARQSWTVTGTSRGETAPSCDVDGLGGEIKWITGVDLMQHSSIATLVSGLQSSPASRPLDLLIISAGFFGTESLESPSWDDEVRMYTTSSVAPVFVVQGLHSVGLLRGSGAKVILVSSESGSITLRHESEGGGNYGHHASKAALNMVGKLLSLDLKDEGVAVGIVHPGFMRSEMTKGVGFDKYWDEGGAVEPSVAAGSLVEWIESFDLSKTGQYWAPRGPADIGTVEDTIGPRDKLPTPLQLPW